MNPRAFLLSLLAMLTAATVPAAAQTQKPSAVPLYWVNIAPGELVGAAFARPYGRLLVAEFAAVLSESGDVLCQQTKGNQKSQKTKAIQKNQIAEHARTTLLRLGAQMFAKIAATVDRPAFESGFAARMGAGAKSELVRLRTDPDVRKFIEIGQPAQHVRVAEYVTVQLDRHALIARIKLARPISQFHSGNPALERADPTDETLDLLDDFIANHKSPAFVRYRDLIEAAQETLDRTISLDALNNLGPVELMSGLPRELANLCVVQR